MLAACSNLVRRCRLGDRDDLVQLAALALVGRSQLHHGLSAPAQAHEVAADQSAACNDAVGTVQISSPSPALPATQSTSSSASTSYIRHYATASASAAVSQVQARRAALAAAAQLVPPDSTWLEHYSRNISPRQLTYRLRKRSSLADLRQGWDLYQAKFDTVAMAALLRRVRTAQIHDPAFDAAAAQQLLDALQPRLRSIALRFGRLRDVTAYLHALAKLGSPLPPARRARGAQAAADAAASAAGAVAAEEAEAESDSDSDADEDEDVGAGAGAASPSAAAAATAPLRQPAELVLELAAWATRDRTELLHAPPRRLATLLWALQRLLPEGEYGGAKLQLVLDRIAMCTVRRLQNFTPRDLRVFALAYGTFGPAAAAAGTKAAAAASRRGEAPSRADMEAAWPDRRAAKAAAEGGEAGGADAAAVERRRSRNTVLLQAIADDLAARYGNLALPQPDPRDMALAAAGLAAHGGPPAVHLPLLTKAAGAAAGALAGLTGGEVAGLAEALAAAGVRHEGLMTAVQAAAKGAVGQEWGPADGEVVGRLAGAFRALGRELVVA